MELSRILNKPQLQAESRDSWLEWIDRIHKATGKLTHIVPVKKLFQQFADATESVDQAVKGAVVQCTVNAPWHMSKKFS